MAYDPPEFPSVTDDSIDRCLRGHERRIFRNANGFNISACMECESELVWRESLSQGDIEFLRRCRILD